MARSDYLSSAYYTLVVEPETVFLAVKGICSTSSGRLFERANEKVA